MRQGSSTEVQSALWGRGGRGATLLAVAVVALTAPLSASAGKPPAAPPDTTITSGPAEGSSSSDTTVAFAFSATTPSSKFSCAVDNGAFGDCSGGATHTLSNLATGTHTFAVRATDKNGTDPSPATRTWTTLESTAPPPPADTTPPAVSITGGPAMFSTAAGPATFTFASNEAANFQCGSDASPLGACNGSNSHTIPSPAPGMHFFYVVATDRAGNVSGWAYVIWFTPFDGTNVYLPGSFLAKVQKDPSAYYDVIVEMRKGNGPANIIKAVNGQAQQRGDKKAKTNRPFSTISGFSAKLPGWLVLYMADYFPQVLAITENVRVKATSLKPKQLWPSVVKADDYYPRDAVTCPVDANGAQLDPTCVPQPAYTPPAAPAIAVVDSGIDASRVDDFGGRVVASVNLSDLTPDATGDGRGHGTFVASIAAGASTSYPGAAPGANLVSVRTMDDNGVARTADVIEAADWILAHKDQYNIRVANFSLHSARAGSFKFDPLDHAVERLWFSGVVVVAAAGNFGTGSAVHMDFAPGNDPFVITVGAADINDTLDMGDDTIAPWSAYGPTADGFHKPEVSAPGRYMIGAVPPNATLYGERADHVVENGYMRLSGTSFAAPVVAGAAAALFALHPAWTPNDVKGALMLSAHHLPAVGSFAGGVGEIDLAKAATLNNPPNPNRALSRYVIADAHVLGGYVFDAAGWNDAAKTDASWESASWEDASWESASWESASWESASWESASWESASWEDFSQADSALSDASWEDGGSVD